jgi:hypothetical protein
MCRSMVAFVIAMGSLLPRGVRAQEARPAGAPGSVPIATGPVPEGGLRAGYDWALSRATVGAQLRLPVLPGLALVPSADYVLGARAPAWQMGLDAAIRLGGFAGLYGGAGLGVAHRPPGSGAHTGLDAFAGFAPPGLQQRFLRPYLEARWLLDANRSPFHLVLGINARLR